MVIRQAANGYVADHKGIERVFLTLDDLMRHLLLVYEGRCSSFAGDSYGAVRIVRHEAPDSLEMSACRGGH